MLFSDDNPTRFAQHLGEYIISYKSENSEVIFHVFLEANKTKAQIEFAEGIDFPNVEDSVFSEANNYLVQNGYPKISSYNRIN